MRVIQVKAKPSSRESTVEELEDGSFLVKLKAQPVDGKANQHLIAFLADVFAVPKRDVVLLSGETSREKRVRIVAPRRIPEVLDQDSTVGRG